MTAIWPALLVASAVFNGLHAVRQDNALVAWASVAQAIVTITYLVVVVTRGRKGTSGLRPVK